MTRTSRRLSVAVSVLASIAILAGTVVASEGVSRSATGGGHFVLAGFLDVQFGFSAIAKDDGSAQGSFHQSYTLEGLTTSYWGTVTCLSVDTAAGRAWIGGVVTQVESDDPGARLVGEEVWFRVLDNGQGQDVPDRSTVFGFTPLFETSAAYCAARPWPADDARTWPVTAGNISVR
ncbi:MAG: hypothetical protein WEE03_02110 [Chloroflexota bacterium]